jgi:hypothetical protein
MVTSGVGADSLIEAAQRATAMVAHRAARAHELASQAQSEREAAHRKATRAAASAALAELEELSRTLHAAARLARASVAAIDDELTRAGEAPLPGAVRVEDRRQSERRNPFRDRRALPLAPPDEAPTS